MSKTENIIAIALSKSHGPVQMLQYTGFTANNELSLQLSSSQYTQHLHQDFRPEFPNDLKIDLLNMEVGFCSKEPVANLAGRVLKVENFPQIKIHHAESGVNIQIDDIHKLFVINVEQQKLPGFAAITEYFRDLDIKDVILFKGVDRLEQNLTKKFEKSVLMLTEFSEKFRKTDFSNPQEQVTFSFDSEEDCFKLEAKGATNRATPREIRRIILDCINENIATIARREILQLTREQLLFQLGEVEKELNQ